MTKLYTVYACDCNGQNQMIECDDVPGETHDDAAYQIASDSCEDIGEVRSTGRILRRDGVEGLLIECDVFDDESRFEYYAVYEKVNT